MNTEQLVEALRWINDVISGEVITTHWSDDTRRDLPSTVSVEEVQSICNCVNSYLMDNKINKRVYSFSRTIFVKDVDVDEEDKQLLRPRYFLNITSGDLFLTSYESNFPKDENYTEISEKCYKNIMNCYSRG